MILKRAFYARDSALVARELLGKILVHEIREGTLRGKIVETEAYYGIRDPASRAYRRSKRSPGMAAQMFKQVGTAFVYMVHSNWLFNVIARAKSESAGGVLIRAIEPIDGIDLMFKNRKSKNKKVQKITELCSGPGRLTQAFRITNSHSGLDLTKRDSGLWIERGIQEHFKIARSHRIGVRRDLPRKLRFYIRRNPFVSR